LDERCSEDMFISEGNLRVTSQFCKVELGPTQILKIDEGGGKSILPWLVKYHADVYTFKSFTAKCFKK
jgi:hypothetical protein